MADLKFSSLIGIAFCVFLGLVILSDSAPEGSLINFLPGFNGNFLSKHYSGYINIDGKEDGKNLFYYFVESERDPRKDAVVLWLNGGPGCSSFDGFVYEHGPFNFKEGNTKGSLPTLHHNPYSWSKVSNMIYLDSPTGVGLSYSLNKSNYVTGDIQTADDTHIFLLKWFEQFPEFLSNEFYVSGESYAGVYVPTLAYQVALGLQCGAKPTINLKGYMVGNGVTDEKFDGNALVPFVHGMGLISEAMFQEAETSCKGNYYDPQNQSCLASLNKIFETIDGLNIYDILEPCYHSPGEDKGNKTNNLPLSFQRLGESEGGLPVRKRMFGRAWPFRAPVKQGNVPTWPQLAAQSNHVFVPCVNDEIATAWLNNEGVRAAIHAQPKNVAGEWDLCTDRILYNSDTGSLIPFHLKLTALGYRALIFSGDHDMCIPFTGSEAWTSSLGFNITDEWRSWISNDQIGGYTQGYSNNLTFLTIKGAGHTVPEYKPREALDFYSRWLAGKQI